MKIRIASVLAACLCVAAIAGGVLRPSAAGAQSADDNLLSRESVLRDPDVPVLGNPDGDITIVEYFDYQCPYCKKVNPDLQKVVQEDGHIRLVFKDWPLFGDASVNAAGLTLAAKYQNRYQEAHDALITIKARLTETNVREALGRAGVDVERAMQDRATNRTAIEALLARNQAQAVAFGFRGTPAFIIGHFRVAGALDAATFKQAITEARAAQQSK